MEPPWLVMGEEYNEKMFSVHPHHPSCMVHSGPENVQPNELRVLFMCQSLSLER